MGNTDLAPGAERKHVWGGRLLQPQPVKVLHRRRRAMGIMGQRPSDKSASSVMERPRFQPEGAGRESV